MTRKGDLEESLLDDDSELDPISANINPGAKIAFFSVLGFFLLASLALIVGYYARASDIRESEGTADDHEEQIAELEPLLYTGVVGSLATALFIGVGVRYQNLFLTCCGICGCDKRRNNRGIALSSTTLPQRASSTTLVGRGRHPRRAKHNFGPTGNIEADSTSHDEISTAQQRRQHFDGGGFTRKKSTSSSDNLKPWEEGFTTRRLPAAHLRNNLSRSQSKQDDEEESEDGLEESAVRSRAEPLNQRENMTRETGFSAGLVENGELSMEAIVPQDRQSPVVDISRV